MATKDIEYYSDFVTSFDFNDYTHDLIKLKNEDDIKQSIKLLINTRYYERLWKPWIGSYIQDILFLQDDSTTHIMLKDQIETVIGNYEPRVKILNIDIYHKSAQDVEKGCITVDITYKILYNNATDTVTVELNRIA